MAEKFWVGARHSTLVLLPIDVEVEQLVYHLRLSMTGRRIHRIKAIARMIAVGLFPY
jgi:hypothetical protein